ncbi:MAG: hypothetical protein WCF26_20325 [Candidatus Sulfotelmatobacter sp.]
MEGLTRLVADSLARHGFDRPVDFRRLQWSRWFRCDSHHSLLHVPSKPGVFALAEEILPPADADVGTRNDDVGTATAHVGTDAFVRPGGEAAVRELAATPAQSNLEPRPKRMLAVTQFFEDDDMAFVLDRMLSRPNPMRSHLESGRYFVRFVVIEDPLQRRTVCSALNQWILSAAEKASGLGSHFASSLELTPATEFVARTPSSATAGGVSSLAAASKLDSGAAANIHCSPVFPSGF